MKLVRVQRRRAAVKCNPRAKPLESRQTSPLSRLGFGPHLFGPSSQREESFFALLDLDAIIGALRRCNYFVSFFVGLSGRCGGGSAENHCAHASWRQHSASATAKTRHAMKVAGARYEAIFRIRGAPRRRQIIVIFRAPSAPFSSVLSARVLLRPDVARRRPGRGGAGRSDLKGSISTQPVHRVAGREFSPRGGA